MISLNKNRILWIDAAKFAAMLAVIIDHTNEVLYANTKIAHLSYFNVSVFILMMGYTSYLSMSQKHFTLSKKIWGIIGPYIAATVIYCVIENKFFDFTVFINYLIHFNASGPFYYVLLYIQLVLISPVIFQIFKTAERAGKFEFLVELLVLIPITFLSSWTTNYTNILSVYGGGGKLLGGSYLCLLYMGMWFAKYSKNLQLKKWQCALMLIVSVLVTAGFAYIIANYDFLLDKNGFFGGGVNPPGFTLGFYAIAITAVFFALGSLLDFYPGSTAERVFAVFSSGGKHTLYIFLYHMMFIKYILNPLMPSFYAAVGNFNIVRLMYFAVAIFGSIAIEYILKAAYKLLAYPYQQLER